MLFPQPHTFRFLTSVRSLFLMLVSGCLLLPIPNQTAAADEIAKPVILLTGFEPFGPQRPPNPSWEGIRDLDQTDWNGFRLIAHQMPVVWGEPLTQLQQQIEMYSPEAVFSFGQGRSGSFAIESLARNSRGAIPDNLGRMPDTSWISPNGPKSFQSSFPCNQIRDLLEKKDFPVQVSRDAGQYLCEETLYSLETLRESHKEMTVAFFHVPPLGSTVGDQIVDGPYVRQFVVEVLASWKSHTDLLKAQGAKVTPTVMTQKADNAEENPELPAIKILIEGYFKSWSEQRMKDYAACFAEGAVIQEVTQSGQLYTQSKTPFVVSQSSYHKSAVHKAIEVPVKTDITFEADLSRAVVYWKLTAGPRTQFGYDHFTLIKQGGEWKIANLVFYGTKERE